MESKKKAKSYKSKFLDKYLSRTSPKKKNRVSSVMMLASKIADGMKKKGLGKKEFALLMGKQPSVITKWLSGSHNFTAFTLADIEYTLNIKLLDTFFEEDERTIEASYFSEKASPYIESITSQDQYSFPDVSIVKPLNDWNRNVVPLVAAEPGNDYSTDNVCEISLDNPGLESLESSLYV